MPLMLCDFQISFPWQSPAIYSIRFKNSKFDPDATAASSFGVDIAGYYQSEEEAYNDFNGRWRGGFAIQNLGPKIKYD